MRRTRELTPRRAGGSAGWWLALVALLAAVLPARLARAEDKDADALIAIAESMDDFLNGKSAAALKKLAETLKGCESGCQPSTRAELLVAQGTIQGTGTRDMSKARASFDAALREDPTVTLDRQFATRDVEKAFAEAKLAFKKSGGAPPPARPPPSKEQMEAVKAAQAELAQKDWSSCMTTVIASMTDKEFAAGKLLLAQCEDLGSLILEATADARLALKYAGEEQNADVAKRAQELVDKLEADTPHIALTIPKSVDKPLVTIDGVVVPPDKLDKPIAHNPGKATVEVKGKKGSFPFSFKSTEVVDRGEQLTVNAAGDAAQGSSAVIQCIMGAKTAADVNLCIETGGKGRGLTLHGGLELSTYNDDDNVDVMTPALFLSAENPTAGWQLGGSFLVDVVTQASADIVATASRRLDEVRYAGTLAGDYKIGVAKVGVSGGASVEPDYVGRSIGGSVAADLVNKTVSPTLAYHFGKDTIGRVHTPFDVFSRPVTIHTIDGGVSLVLSPSTIAVFGATLVAELGDTSKPYRHVPLFTADVAKQMPRGATPQLVNAVRIDAAPLEQLPDTRTRFALLGRAAHRFETATLRGDERIYIDSWGLKASTTDARYLMDLDDKFRVGPHVRLHVQGPVDFWKRAYSATQTPSGWEIPKYRAGDRELGPLFGLTLGGSARYAFSKSLAITFEAEGLYTQFLDHIYLYDRWSLFTATTFELEVD